MSPLTKNKISSSVAAAQMPVLSKGAGVYDLNAKRQKTLEEVDTAKVSYVLEFLLLRNSYSRTGPFWSWFHVRVVLVAGAGFFTDA